jgi:hypothetical protein
MARQDEMVEVVARWRSSGKSRIAFARESGIAISTLQRWIKRVEQHAEPTASAAAGEPAGHAPVARFVEIAHAELPARPRSRRQQPSAAQPSAAQPSAAQPSAAQPSEPATPRLRLELGDGVILTLY